MGYYTKYTLDYSIPEHQLSKSVKQFVDACDSSGIKIPTKIRATFDKKLSLEDELKAELIEPSDYGSLMDFVTGRADSCKWYGHDADLKKLSIKFPTILFTLKGVGEESDDLWIKYFKGGKMQTCQAKITFDEFDETKLQ